MAKIKIEHTLDGMGTSCIRLTKSRGKITLQEAWETLTKEGCYGPKLMTLRISDELPMDLYDEGDEWTVYDPDDIYPKLAEEKFNEGYEACLNDHEVSS